jgi:hypothetical protein
MLDITSHIFELFISTALIGVGIALYLQHIEMLRVRAMLRRERADRQALCADFAAVLECSRNLGARVRSHDLLQQQLSKKLEGIDRSREPDATPVYERVYKLVAQGLSIDEIADICDLGRGEVELLSHIAERRAAA